MNLLVLLNGGAKQCAPPTAIMESRKFDFNIKVSKALED